MDPQGYVCLCALGDVFWVKVYMWFPVKKFWKGNGKNMCGLQISYHSPVVRLSFFSPACKNNYNLACMNIDWQNSKNNCSEELNIIYYQKEETLIPPFPASLLFSSLLHLIHIQILLLHFLFFLLPPLLLPQPQRGCQMLPHTNAPSNSDGIFP